MPSTDQVSIPLARRATVPYVSRLKAHLTAYKRERLGVVEDGRWARTGLPYPHILPAALRGLNLLSPLRDQLSGYLAGHSQIRLHRDFHHLNSSQAMCFNLMYPVLTSPSVQGALQTVLGLPVPLDPETACFEKIVDPAEGTNFDFFVCDKRGASVFFEFKLSESGFGTAVPDQRHLNKLRDSYAPRLAEWVDARALQPANFFPSYQLMRNLSHLTSAWDVLVMVLPRGHVKLAAQAKAFVDGLTGPAQERVRVVYMENIVAAFLAAVDGKDILLTSHYEEFAFKYCIS